MPHDDKLFVYYIDRTTQVEKEKEDVYDWNSHSYSHSIDEHGNLVIVKRDNPASGHQPIHVKTYAKGIWTRVFLDYDEHATP